jgi:hypothetical protein
MKTYYGLPAFLVLTACANHADIHLNIDMPRHIDEAVAKKIVLTWVLENGEYEVPTKYWINETREKYSGECSELFVNADGTCKGKYLISILNKNTECVSQMYPVLEHCDSEKCVYSFGPEIGQILCW